VKLSLLLLSVCAVARCQQPPSLPQTAVFAFGGYGVKVDGTIGYAQLLSQASATYSFTAYRFVPAHGSLTPPTPVLMTGALPRLRSFGWVTAYASGLAGGGTTAAGATVGAFSLGGLAVVSPPKWTHWAFAIGADEQKTAGGRAYANFDAGLVFHP
jgi:hypothetical protein